MENVRHMIPCTNSVLESMLARVIYVLVEHGLVDFDKDKGDTSQLIVQMLKAQGQVSQDGYLKMGKCMLLPRREHRMSLLLISPCQADEYDDELRKKSSPIQFDRTADGRVTLSARWLISRLEDVSGSHAAPLTSQTSALHLSRTGRISDVILPHDVETIALTVMETNGTDVVIEALPGGTVLEMDCEE